MRKRLSVMHCLRLLAFALALLSAREAVSGQYGPGDTFRDCGECPEMVVVPPGSFMMGSPETEEGRFEDEGPRHRVTIREAFAAGRFEVTFREWDACVSDGGCGSYRPDDEWGRYEHPVINVSWEDAKGYVEWLRRKTGKKYRLLSEAEWEYAARAGTETPFHTGLTIEPWQANYDGQYSYGPSQGGPYAERNRKQTTPVGSFEPNRFGLYDMHGNVFEWVEDCNNVNYRRAPVDGSAWLRGNCGERVLRGGSWVGGPEYLRSALRFGNTAGTRYHFIGFRVARTLN